MRLAFFVRLNKVKFLIIPAVAVFLFALILIPTRSHAATFTWDGDGGDSNLSTAGNWAGGTAPTGATTDDLIFTGSTGLIPNNDLVGATFASIFFTAGGFKLKGNDFSLVGGSSALSATTGSSTVAANITFSTAAPTISISSGAHLNVTGTIDNGGLTITMAASGNFGSNGVISGTGAMIKTGTAELILSGANTFSGGLTVKEGSFIAGVSNSGSTSGAAGPSTSGITLGASDGGSAAVMGTTSASVSISNAITLGSSAVGTLSIGGKGSGIPTLSGAIALNGNNLTVFKSNSASNGVTLTGGVTGTGNINLVNNSSSGALSFTTIAVNNVGTITSSGTSSGTNTITGGVGANVTTITLNSTTSALTISTTALTVNSTATTLVNSSGTKILTVSGGITGTGNLILQNDSTTASGITISTTAVNHTGTVTNSGTGVIATVSGGGALISAVIGTNVTGVTQNSSSNGLTLSGANTFTGGLTVQCGAFIPAVSNSGSTSGAAGPSTSTITLGSSSGCAATISAPSAYTISNPITLGSGAVGSTTITNTSSMPTYSGAINLNGNNLTIAQAYLLSGTFTVSGGITGTGNLFVSNASASSGTLTFTTNPVNNVGFIENTNTATGAGNTVSITGGVGSNVTAIRNNSNSYITVTTTALTVNSSGTTLQHKWASVVYTLQVSGGITGTGDLTLRNDASTSNGVTITTTSVNHTGSITNSGTGAGSVYISAVIGTNVTGLTQNTSNTNSTLTLVGANTFTGGLTIKKGIVTASVSNVDTTSGAAGPSTSTLTLGSSDGGLAQLTVSSGITVSNPITLGTSAAGTTTISNSAGTVSGAISLNGNNLALSVGSGSTVSGAISGTGNVIVSASPSSGNTATLSGSSINNVGTVQITNSGAGTVALDATIGSNVTHFRYISSASGPMTVSGSNTFNAFRDNDGSSTHTIQFTAGTTQTIGAWDVSGDSDSLLTLSSSSGGTPWSITSATAGNQVSDYIILSDSAAAGSSSWYAGSHSTNGSGNTGWSFSDAPAQLAFYQLTADIDRGSTFSPAVIVAVQDASGKLASTASNSITLTLGSNPGQAYLSGTLTKSASGGYATFDDLSLDKRGYNYTLNASSSGLTGATSGAFNIRSLAGGGGSSGGGSPASATSPSPSPAAQPPSSPQSTLNSLIKQLLELQAKVSSLNTETVTVSGSTAIVPHEGAAPVIISEVSRPLTIGGKGDDVESLQNFLIIRGVGPAAQQLKAVGSTAFFGQITKSALTEFQRSAGLPATGYFGPMTKAYLKKLGY